ncbi:MAG TPA: zinc ribbon domain-containing protein [Gemmatimonadales bacterium]|nr:zinc ribbon domain-containing protein [Gemmatimonadales bacterium]
MALERPGDDVDRLFRQLVLTLAERPGAQVPASFQVSELYQEILPYRTCRATLRFDSNEDYEMAVLRLLAGVRGYASLDPPEAGDALKVEADAVNPYPGAFRDFAAARVTLSRPAVQAVLDGRASYAPEAPPEAGPSGPPVVSPPTLVRATPSPGLPYMLEAVRETISNCPHCRRHLPSGRVVVYCPHCGGAVSASRCPKCDTELEPGWRFCITCRHAVIPKGTS